LEMPAYVKMPVIALYLPVVHFGLGFFNAAFSLLTVSRFSRVWGSVYYIVPLVLFTWHILYPILISPVVKRMTRDEKDRLKKEN